MKCYRYLLVVIFLTVPLYLALSQSPTAPAEGFNVFTLDELDLTTNETEGPVATGGDLAVSGNYQVAIHSGGSFLVGGEKIGLLVGGKVIYNAGQLTVHQRSYVKIGDATNSQVWYTDNNGASSPIRITPTNNYNAMPRIQIQANRNDFGGVGPTNNPVIEGGLLDFNSAFQTMQNSSASIAACTNNAQITNPNGQPVTPSTMPNQVKISLQNGVNYLNLTGSQINNVSVFTYSNQPSANQILVVNVDAPGNFTWNVWNQAGIGFNQAKYIIYNFPNTTDLNIAGNSTIMGTVFAPFANITKTVNQSNIQGQVIGKKFTQSGGEVHYALFESTISGCGSTGTPPTANFTVNNSSQCLIGNSFAFANNSNAGSSNVTYLWNFGDGTSSTQGSPTKSFATAGNYTVTLTATNNTGSDTETVTVTVHPSVDAVVTQSTVSSSPGNIVKEFSINNASDYVSWSWELAGQGSGLQANQNPASFTFTQPGNYVVTVNTVDNNGCSNTTDVPVSITSVPSPPATPSFTVNDDEQCLDGNSFQFQNTSTNCAPFNSQSYNSSQNAEAAFNNLYFSAEGRGGNNQLNGTFELDIHNFSPYTILSQDQYVWPNGQDVPFTIVYDPNATGNDKFVYTVGTPGVGSGQRVLKLDPVNAGYPQNINGVYFYSRTAPNTTLEVSNLVIDGNNVGTLGHVNPSSSAFVYQVFSGTDLNDGFSISGQINFAWTGNIPSNSEMNFNFKIGNLNCIPLSGGQSGNMTYTWDFGDSTTSTQGSPLKTYNAAGNYTVTLTATNSSGSTSTSQTVTVYPSVDATVTETVTASVAGSVTKEFTITNPGDFASWSWELAGQGSGLQANQNPASFTFTQPGNYVVKVNTVDNNGCSNTTDVAVTIGAVPPTADFSVNDDEQCLIANSFSFNNNTLSGGGTVTYLWDFGDGTTSSNPSPTKTFATAGIYTVTLTATNNAGSDNESTTVTVHSSTNPVITSTQTGSTVGTITQSFSITNINQFSTWSWSVPGQGTNLYVDQNPISITFSQSGTYDITVIAEDMNGCTDENTISMNINVAGGCENPFEPVQGFHLVSFDDINLDNADIEGPLAARDELNLLSISQIASLTDGSYNYLGNDLGLVAGGKVTASGVSSVGHGYAKLAFPQATGTVVWYRDPNNNHAPIRITSSSSYTDPNRIELGLDAVGFGNVSASTNPVFENQVFDFVAAKQKLISNATELSQRSHTVDIYDVNGQPVTTSAMSGSISIDVQNAVNYFNANISDLNRVTDISFNQLPSSNSVLVFNLTIDDVNWDIWDQINANASVSPYIIYNITGANNLTLGGDDTVYGSILAPSTVLSYSNQRSFLGQVAVQSFDGVGQSQFAYELFDADIISCSSTPAGPPVADFNVNFNQQCLEGNVFAFTNTSSSPNNTSITYSWDFGDGTSSNMMSPDKTYLAAGTYQVHLTASNASGSDVLTRSVEVYPVVLADVSFATSSNTSNSVTKEFTLNNSADFVTWDWSLSGVSSHQFTDQNPVEFTFTQAGYYEVIVTGSDAINGCESSTIVPVVIQSSEVSTGNNGGIESESLGDAVARVYVKRKMTSQPTKLIKSNLNLYDKGQLQLDNAAKSNVQTMADIFPEELYPGNEAHITSPTDILDYTIAEEVLSVDFSVDGKSKGVVLGVKTSDSVYNHTKASCDRLKGAEILNIKTVHLEGYDFLMQAIKQRTGEVEYAISFAAGKDDVGTNYVLQTNWYVNHYMPFDTVFNFQVWATHPDETQKMVRDMLDNLRDFQPVVQHEQRKFPSTYVSKISRDRTEMHLKLRSLEVGKQVEIEMDEIYSETNGFSLFYNPYITKKEQTVSIYVGDGYEYEGLIIADGEIQDAFYHADGNWGMDFDRQYTTVEKYRVHNNFERVYNEEEYPIHREVELEAYSDYDYLTLYKSLLPGNIPADYSEYSFLAFTASGSGLLELGLVKSSIEQWPAQYRAMVNIPEEEKTYYIPFDFFTSSANQGNLMADDLTLLTFTFLPVEARTNDLDLYIKDVKFTKSAPAGYEDSLLSLRNEFIVFPNPVRDRANLLIYSDHEEKASLTLYDLTGRMIYKEQVMLKSGKNELSVNIDSAKGVNFLSLKSAQTDYGTVKLVVR